MGTISIILTRPPYGTVDASEALRHALGGVTEDMAVKLVLFDGGVMAAVKGQDVSDTEYRSIEEGLRDCIEMGVDVCVDRGSLKEQQIEAEQLIEGVSLLSSYEVSEIIKDSDTVMIF
jgi:sulfur relay (sulfurtransferase) DsrF/TusC family protein